MPEETEKRRNFVTLYHSGQNDVHVVYINECPNYVTSPGVVPCCGRFMVTMRDRSVGEGSDETTPWSNRLGVGHGVSNSTP